MARTLSPVLVVTALIVSMTTSSGTPAAGPPGHRYRREPPVFDPVPLARPRWQVQHRDLQVGLGGETGQLGLPQSQPAAVGPARIGGVQHSPRRRVFVLAHGVPPAPDRLHRELAGVGVGAQVHPAGVAVTSYTP